MSLYNFTNISNATNIGDVVIVVSRDIVPGLGNLILIAVFATFFIALKGYESLRAFTAAMFVTFLVSLMFFLLGIVGQESVLLTAIGFVGSLIAIYVQ